MSLKLYWILHSSSFHIAKYKKDLMIRLNQTLYKSKKMKLLLKNSNKIKELLKFNSINLNLLYRQPSREKSIFGKKENIIDI